MDNIPNLVFPFATLVLGALVGHFSSHYIETKKEKSVLITKLFEHYIEVRQSLTELLSEIANLSLHPSYDNEQIDKWKSQVSKLFYEHYDFLPHEVLLSLNCLHMCLSVKGTNIYVISENSKIKKLAKKDTRQINEFIRDVTLIDNFDGVSSLFTNGKWTKSTAMNFQARKVLRSINDNFKYEHITSWGTNLKKLSINEISNKK